MNMHNNKDLELSLAADAWNEAVADEIEAKRALEIANGITVDAWFRYQAALAAMTHPTE